MHRFVIFLCCLLLSSTTFAATSVQDLQQLILQKRFSAAIQMGELLLQRNATHPRARFLTAYALQMSKQVDKATVLYQGLIEDNPDLPEPRNNLAMIFLAQGDYDRASQLLVDAINTHTSYATAYNNLSQVYKGIASEAYRRAVSESSSTAQHTSNIKLTPITELDTLAPEPEPEPEPEPKPKAIAGTEPEAKPKAIAGAKPEAKPEPIAVVEPEPQPNAVAIADPAPAPKPADTNQETRLIAQVKRWAEAWSTKDMATYIDLYAPQHRAKFNSHDQWVAQRRQRIERPGRLVVEVSNIQIKWRSENRAIIDFRQDFSSPTYSDQVIKRLSFNRMNSEWKITEERVLSVL